MNPNSAQLKTIYARRFEETAAYRNEVWKLLTAHFFNRWVRAEHDVLDLGCGYGEFINNIPCARKWAMDLNPETARRLQPEVKFLPQDCSAEWPLPPDSLDIVFTSNFFEHLPDKACLTRTIQQARRCLKPGGRLLALGPNLKHLPGRYWDFYDHHTMLTEMSLVEALEIEGFRAVHVLDRFLPYTMQNAPRYPVFFVRLYLALPLAWKVFGAQFFVVAEKAAASA
jgi:SAM-dependent methyltransferase